MTARANRHYTLWLGCALSVCYFLVVSVFAHKKLLWTDELFTVLIAQQPTMDRFFGILLDGPDVLPPLSHMATRLAIGLIGPTHIAYRLPEAMGVWLALFSTYQFIRCRAGLRSAYTAVFAIVGFDAFAYAYEARPYGMLMGFSGLSLLCWQRSAASSDWRWQAGLSVAIFVATGSHWYGLLCVVPLLAGEASRWVATRRSDPRMALAVMAGLTATLVFLPFANQAVTFRGMVPPPASLAEYLRAVYSLVGGLLLAGLLLALVVTWVRGHFDERRAWPSHELAAAYAAALLPLAAFVLAHLSAGQSLARYAIATGAGVALLVGITVEMVGNAARLFKSAALVVALAAAGVNVASLKLRLEERSMLSEGKSTFSLLSVRASALEPIPIVVQDVHSFMPLHFYAPDPLKSRLTYIAGPNVMAAQALSKLARFSPIVVVGLDDFLARHEDFYFYDHGVRTPLLATLVRAGALVTDSGVNETRDIYPRPGYLYRVRLWRQPVAVS